MKDRFIIQEQGAFTYSVEEQNPYVFKVSEQNPFVFVLTEVSGDVLAPAFVSAILTDPYHLAINLDEALAAVLPDIIDFVFDIDITDIEISEETLILSLDSPAQAGQEYQVGYIPGANPLQDAEGNLVAAFTEDVDSSVLVDPPAITTAEMTDAFTLDINFHKTLAGVTPDLADFVPDYSGGEINVLTRTVSGSKITLAVDIPVQSGETLSIGYIPGANKLQGLDDNYVVAFDQNIDVSVIVAPPVITSIEVGAIDGYTWRIVLSKSVTGNSLPSSFSVPGFTFNEFNIVGSNEVEYISDQLAVYGQSYNGTFTKDELLQGLNDNYVTTQDHAVINNVPDPLPAIPTGLAAVWVNDFARLTVDDIPSDVQIEWYKSKNGGSYTLVTTTAVDVVTTDNYTWQNEAMAFKCRAKKGSQYSDYCAPVNLSTPLVFKSNQATLNTLVIYVLYITAGKTVNINWGDGTNADYSGNYTNINHAYASTGQYFVALSGDTNFILRWQMYSQVNIYGDISKWVLPTSLNNTLYFYSTSLTGNISNWVIPSGLLTLYAYDTSLTGATPQITAHATNGLNYRISVASLSSNGTTVFRKAMTVFNINSQNVSFPIAQIDALLAAILAWYTANAPTANCVYSMKGTNMAAPSAQGHTDMTAIIALYTAQGKTCTIYHTA